MPTWPSPLASPSQVVATTSSRSNSHEPSSTSAPLSQFSSESSVHPLGQELKGQAVSVLGRFSRGRLPLDVELNLHRVGGHELSQQDLAGRRQP